MLVRPFRSIYVAALVVLAAAGCAQLIGADFDGAHLADGAGTLDDASIVETSPGTEDGDTAEAESDAYGDFDARAPGDLVFWVSADFGVADGGVPEGGTDANATLAPGWSDRSGNAHDLAQAFLAKQPLLVPDAQNGLPVVRFESARGTCYGSTWLGNMHGRGATAFIVAKGQPSSLLRIQGTNPGYFIFPWNAHYYDPDAAPDLTFLVFAGSDSSKLRIPFDDTKWTLATARLELGKLGGMQVFKNGRLLESSSIVADAMPQPDGFQVGCTPGQLTEFANADVGEILLYATPLDDTNRASVERYLKSKWAIDF